jgi:signal transduction histidine kinase
MKPLSLETPPAGTGALPRVGHGLPGMRERAALVGGSLTVGPDGDAFVVNAFLPAGASA